VNISLLPKNTKGIIKHKKEMPKLEKKGCLLMKRLKRIVLKIPIDPRYKEIFDLLENYETLQIHRYDENVIYVTQKMQFKSANSHPKDLVGKFGIEFNEVLTENKQKKEYICFTKHHWYKELHLFFKNPEILIEPPIIMKEDSIIIRFISHGKNIDAIIEQQKKTFNDNFKILSITSVHPNKDNLSLLLTERQKEIAYYVVERGYYEIPRKTNSEFLANHFGISKSALCEHLRKIEKTIFLSIFK